MRAFAVALALAAGLIVSLTCGTSAAHQERGSERVEDTAYTLEGGEVSLGVLRAELGLIDQVSVGTYVPTWFTFPWLRAPIPTGFVKLRDPWNSALAFSLRGNFVYLDADVLASKWVENAGTHASVWVLPLEAAASYRFSKRFTQSVEATYVAVHASGQRSTDATIRGAATLTNVTLSTLSELRLSRVVALTLLTRAMVYRGNAHVQSQYTEGATTVRADLGARDPYRGLVACAVPGVSLSFSHVNLELGLGYGNFWLPALELPLPDRGLVPSADLNVRF